MFNTQISFPKMKSQITLLRSLIITLLLIAGMGEGMAQDDNIVKVTFRISTFNKVDTTFYKRTVKWGTAPNIEKAEEIVKDIRANGETAAKKHKIEIKGRGGTFSNNFPINTYVIVYNEEYPASAKWLPIMPNMDTVEDSVSIIEAVGGSATGEFSGKDWEMTISTNDSTEYFNLIRRVDTALVKNSTRIFLQNSVVDCTTEDTVFYFPSVVFEKKDFHRLQDRRFDYDYNGKGHFGNGTDSANIPINSVRNMSIDSLKIENGKYVISRSYEYRKQNKKRTYKSPSRISVRDFHHVYYDSISPGSCLRNSPLKFVNFDNSLPELIMSDEFEEKAMSNYEKKSQNLELRFKVNSDILEDDSLNNLRTEQLATELQSFGDRLISPTIIGTASPDGREDANRVLAMKRARSALNLLKLYLPAATQRILKVADPKVYTWEDVAVELELEGKNALADSVRLAANGKGDREGDQAVAALPAYEEYVKPVLEKLRKMECLYMYEREYIMNAQEVKEAYYAHKTEYIEGKRKPLSYGDFYNLYNVIDSVEYDTVTILAYRELKKDKDFLIKPISPYVFWRQELLNQKNGVPDTLTLAPFIDTKLGFNVHKTIYGDITLKMNRPEIVATQAMSYFLLGKFDKARQYIKKFQEKKDEYPELQKLEYYILLMDYMPKESQIPAKDKVAYLNAKDFILSNLENRAILYTEFPQWSKNIPWDEINNYVNLLDDANPKKWYLKGLLWAREEQTSKISFDDFYSELYSYDDKKPLEGFKLLSEEAKSELSVDDFAKYAEYLKWEEEYLKANPDAQPEETAKDEKEEVNIEGIQPYLAYFHHSFELEPTFKRHYFKEAYISEENRLKQGWGYKKKDIPAYKRLFELLKKQDDIDRQTYMESEGLTEEDIKEANNTEVEDAD